MSRRNVFFTSDWHIGHANVLKYSNRPFRDTKHMAEVLVNNFNASVSPDSITYFIGDMGLGPEKELKDVISKLNGTKILIIGNHDKGYNSMLEMGFAAVMHSVTLFIANTRVTLSHCPLTGIWREHTEGNKGAMPGDNWHGEHKYKNYSLEDVGQFHLHGHIHSPNSGKSVKILGRQMDVGVDANSYRPVSISQIESWIAKSKK